MYPNVQNDSILTNHQIKQKTDAILNYVDDTLYILDDSNIIPEIIMTALENDDVCTCNKDVLSILLNKNIEESRKYLTQILQAHVRSEFDDLFAWSDETSDYYEV